MQLCFFEDETASNFLPLTLTRPVDDLRMGIYTIREKWELALNSNKPSARIVPDYMQGVFSHGEISAASPCLWINSRFLPRKQVIEQIKTLPEGSCLVAGAHTIAAKISGAASQKMHSSKTFSSSNLEKINAEAPQNIAHFWDLTHLNASEIEHDIPFTQLKPIQGIEGKSKHVIFIGSESIYISDKATIKAGSIIDATNGPVVIMPEVTIEEGSILKGPVAICQGATVKSGARIYGGSTIGPVCKVCGEISSTIFHSYSNKAHDGYVGNSIFGQWVNLGAGTTTSNLKNDYGTVKITHWQSGDTMDTGTQFLGTIMADHSKTAIHTSLNTGTVCGVSSNIFLSGLTPKFIPSFSWMGPDGTQTYRFEKALEVMRVMMARRNILLSSGYERMMQHIFKQG